jgi:hypothetical protein
MKKIGLAQKMIGIIIIGIGWFVFEGLLEGGVIGGIFIIFALLQPGVGFFGEYLFVFMEKHPGQWVKNDIIVRIVPKF